MGKWIENTVLNSEVQMANKYMKKCSTPLAIKEMQIKTTLNQRLHAFSHMWNIGLIQTEVIF
jgi:hypothetical protein